MKQKESPLVEVAVEATVGKVIDDVVENKCYFVAYVEEGALSGEPVTVSMKDWKGPGKVERGLVVILFNIRKHAAGWRAESAAAVVPEGSTKEAVNE